MSATLSSWKEIAQYIGKGVRTVQRWERQMGLPVRRAPGRTKGTVIALAEELDSWMGSEFKTTSEVAQLRRQVAELKKENEQLSAKLKRAERRAQPKPANGSANGEERLDQAFWMHCSTAVERNTALRLRCAEVIDASRNMRLIRQMQREHTASPLATRSMQ